MQVRRGVMGLVGALAGWCLYALGEVWAQGMLQPRLALAVTVFGAVGFGGVLAMAGPIRLARAALGALGLALVAAVLVTLAGLRFDDPLEMFRAPATGLALLVVAGLPMPFWIAASLRAWDHYPTLFAESWGMVMRLGTAALFTGIVWAVIFLSDALLSLVGVDAIGRFLAVAAVPWVLTGVAFGFAIGVVIELADYVSPFLVLRLLRLLLPVVLGVMALFLVALAFGGMGRLTLGLSVAGTLIAMAWAGVALVSVAVDGRDGAAAHGWLARVARGMAAMVAVPGALALWAVGRRVAEAGFSPARLAAGTVAAVVLGYGVLYLLAALSGPGWMARVRRANTAMAVVAAVVAALWLTPLVNAERIAARDQVARFRAGTLPLARLDLEALGRWGRPGARARDALAALAAEPGQEALAARLTGAPGEAARGGLAALMPVSPPGGDAAAILATLEPWEVRDWTDACNRRRPDGAPGCVLVIADFWPDVPGDEAMALFVTPEGWLRSEARMRDAGGVWRARPTASPDGGQAEGDTADAVLHALQGAPPTIEPYPQNVLRAGPMRLMIQP